MTSDLIAERSEGKLMVKDGTMANNIEDFGHDTLEDDMAYINRLVTDKTLGLILPNSQVVNSL